MEGILVDLSEPPEPESPVIPSKFITDIGTVDDYEHDEEDKENVVSNNKTTDSIELGRDTDNSRRNSLTLLNSSPIDVRVLADVTDRTLGCKRLENLQSPAVRLLDEETFDFDLPLTPSSCDRSIEEKQDEEEVFFGPVGFTERCVSVAVASSDPVEEYVPMSPLKPEQIVELFTEANALVARIVNSKNKVEKDENLGRTNLFLKKDDILSTASSNSDVTAGNLLTVGRENTLSDQSPCKKGHRRSGTFTISLEEKSNENKSNESTTEQLHRLSENSAKEQRCSGKPEKKQIVENGVEAKLKSEEVKDSSKNSSDICDKVKSSKLQAGKSRLLAPRTRPGSNLKMLNSGTNTSKLAVPEKSLNGTLSSSSESLSGSNRSLNFKSTSAEKKTQVKNPVPGKSQARLSLNPQSSNKKDSKTENEPQSSKLKRASSLRAPSKYTGLKGTSSSAATNSLKPASTETAALVQKTESAPKAALGSSSKVEKPSQVIKSGISVPRVQQGPPTKLQLMKPGMFQRKTFIAKRTEQTGTAKPGPMKAVVQPLAEKAQKPTAVRSNSDSNVPDDTSMKGDRPSIPKRLLSSSFSTPHKSGSVSSTESSSPVSVSNKRRSFLPTPTKSRIGSSDSAPPPSPLSLGRRSSSVSSDPTSAADDGQSPVVKGRVPTINSNTVTKEPKNKSRNRSVGRYPSLDFLDDSSPSALKPRRQLVVNTPNMPKKQLSQWSPVKKKPVDLDEQVFLCTKKTAQKGLH